MGNVTDESRRVYISEKHASRYYFFENENDPSIRADGVPLGQAYWIDGIKGEVYAITPEGNEVRVYRNKTFLDRQNNADNGSDKIYVHQLASQPKYICKYYFSDGGIKGPEVQYKSIYKKRINSKKIYALDEQGVERPVNKAYTFSRREKNISIAHANRNAKKRKRNEEELLSDTSDNDYHDGKKSKLDDSEQISMHSEDENSTTTTTITDPMRLPMEFDEDEHKQTEQRAYQYSVFYNRDAKLSSALSTIDALKRKQEEELLIDTEGSEQAKLDDLNHLPLQGESTGSPEGLLSLQQNILDIGSTEDKNKPEQLPVDEYFDPLFQMDYLDQFLMGSLVKNSVEPVVGLVNNSQLSEFFGGLFYHQDPVQKSQDDFESQQSVDVNLAGPTGGVSQ